MADEDEQKFAAEHEKRRNRIARQKIAGYLRLYFDALKMEGDPGTVLERVKRILES
jgi:hypothetical protein